jgi:hypothetical protein
MPDLSPKIKKGNKVAQTHRSSITGFEPANYKCSNSALQTTTNKGILLDLKRRSLAESHPSLKSIDLKQKHQPRAFSIFGTLPVKMRLLNPGLDTTTSN